MKRMAEQSSIQWLFSIALEHPLKAGQEVPQEALAVFHGIRLRFGQGMEGLRNHVFIRFSIVTHHGLRGTARDGLP
jgi:hypothetical protein